jgi:hypothetical protein
LIGLFIGPPAGPSASDANETRAALLASWIAEDRRAAVQAVLKAGG